MLFNAAAAMTPSGVPPMPSSTSTPASGHAGRDGAEDVAVADQLDAGAAGAHLGDQVVVARRDRG